MSKYGEAAIRAVHLFTSGTVDSPSVAWAQATNEIIWEGTPGQVKGCPQNAFLGLCEEGLVKGIPRGQYTRSIKNKQYAVNGFTVLKRKPELASKPRVLWDEVMKGEKKAHNSQMDVVTALWEQGMFEKTV